MTTGRSGGGVAGFVIVLHDVVENTDKRCQCSCDGQHHRRRVAQLSGDQGCDSDDTAEPANPPVPEFVFHDKSP